MKVEEGATGGSNYNHHPSAEDEAVLLPLFLDWRKLVCEVLAPEDPRRVQSPRQEAWNNPNERLFHTAPPLFERIIRCASRSGLPRESGNTIILAYYTIKVNG